MFDFQHVCDILALTQKPAGDITVTPSTITTVSVSSWWAQTLTRYLWVYETTERCRVDAAVWNSSGRLNSPLQPLWSQSGFYPDSLMAPWTRRLLGSAPSLGSKLDSPWWSCRETPEIQNHTDSSQWHWRDQQQLQLETWSASGAQLEHYCETLQIYAKIFDDE